MIKDLRRELAACRHDSWRLDEATELGDMKERLFMSMLPRADASAAGDSESLSDSVACGFASLNALNDEMDAELDALMHKLGDVKHQFSSLDEQRRNLQEELAKEREALEDLGDTGDAGWISDPEEEEFFRREAEEAGARQHGSEILISSFIDSVTVE